ncbi:MAG: hypothetical protein LJF04_12530 [Gemmatimonadetes bacterium]|nr:hypothetical protein [Gemmatimonadota bacterium]
MTKSIRVALPLMVFLAACDSAASRSEATPQTDTVKHVVDSVIPMGMAMDRFRAGLAEPSGLRNDTDSRDALVRQVMQALQDNDTTAFENLAVNRAEWAWLYYPTNVQYKPPYELPPGLAWFQLQETNRRGVLRALRELGGHDIDVRDYTCDPEPTLEGDNKIWTGCRVTLSRDGGDPVTIRLFGAILERGGRFEVLSYDNDF